MLTSVTEPLHIPRYQFYGIIPVPLEGYLFNLWW